MIKISNKESTKNRILSILISKKDPIIISEIAKDISMSGKTVRNYLKELHDELSQKGIKLMKKPNVGVYLDISEDKREILKGKLIGEYKEREIYSPEYRRSYILKTLFKNKYTYTIQLLADDLYCSKSTIVNDLTYVQKWIEDRGLILRRKQNQGLWIEGNERDYRKAMMDLFFEMKEHEIQSNEDEIENLDYRIDFINYKKIKQLFPRIDLYRIQNIIQKAEERLGYFFTDQAFINLITHIAMTIERVKNNKEIKMDKKSLDALKEQYEFQVAKWVISKLDETFRLDFPEDEIGYISVHMLGAKIQENFHDNNYDVLLNTQNEEYIEIAKEIISLAGEILSVDLSNDKLLLSALVLHLRPTIVRLRYGLKLRNPILKRIKNEYTSIFGAAWACSSIFEKKLGVAINEDEVGYIAMHLAVAVGRQNNMIKAVIVCSSGIGTSQLIKNRLEKRFKELDIIACLPLNCLSKELIKEADLIISTIQGIKNNPKVIYVSTLLREKEILKIKSSIDMLAKTSSRKEETSKKSFEHSKVRAVIDKELCFINDEREDFAEIINHYGRIMEEKGFVKEGFCQNVLEREKRGSTIVGMGIAIPHAKQEFVKKSKICIIKLKNPITWNRNRLNLIIILALKFDDISTTKTFFRNFYSILDNDELVKKIMKADNVSDIIEIFIDGGICNE
ncbi:BglG family transcription antiterminator [Wukongibacter sp. M2B1]|uniref:BglG family transcription antiterminator n=1 Tax=Wukongibacter sp. M2B1 TaxID=3088895 RepID=UPI003D7C0812